LPCAIAKSGRFHRARGSLEETKYLLLLGKDVGFITQEECNRLRDGYTKLGKKLNSLIKSLKKEE